MAQSLSQIWIHLVFSTKSRQPFLRDNDLRKRMHGYLKKTCDGIGCNTIAVGGIEDHVHLLFRSPKTESLVHLIEKIKKSSSKWIKSFELSETGKSFYWQAGYGAFSVSQSCIKQVKHYIENQEKHHQKFNFQEEFKNLLIKHRVNYDEQYLWDE